MKYSRSVWAFGPAHPLSTRAFSVAPLTGGHSKKDRRYTKNCVFRYFFQQYLVLFTMAPRSTTAVVRIPSALRVGMGFRPLRLFALRVPEVPKRYTHYALYILGVLQVVRRSILPVPSELGVRTAYAPSTASISAFGIAHTPRTRKIQATSTPLLSALGVQGVRDTPIILAV